MRASNNKKLKVINEKLGKKSWLDNQEGLTGKIDYISGIELFDTILNGKTHAESKSIIHLERYPKGILIELKKGFGGFKSYQYPLSENEIREFVINQVKNKGAKLVIFLNEGNNIEFDINERNLNDTKIFFKEMLHTHEHQQSVERHKVDFKSMY